MAVPNQSYSDNTSVFTANSSFMMDPIYNPARPKWYWVLLGFICVVTTIGNSLVIFLICSKRSFRNKVSPNWFIISLGVSDLLIGTFNIPMQFVCAFTAKCTFLVSNIMYCLVSLFLTASTTNVCLITFDIYLAVFHPFFYPNLMSPTKSRILILGVWVFSAAVNIAMYISALYPQGNINAEVADQVIMFLFYTITSGLLAYAFGRILFVVRSHKNDIEKHQLQVASNVISHETDSISSDRCARVRRRNRDGTITATGIVTACFLVSNGVWQYYLLHLLTVDQIPMTRAMMDITHLVIYFNSTMNFIVYALLRNDLRGEMDFYFKRFCFKVTVDHSEFTSLEQRHTNRNTRSSIVRSTRDNLSRVSQRDNE